MNTRLAVGTALLVATLACESQSAPIDATGTWVGTITTQGNVTTVVNESGSVWGGTATLVEEVSIGVDEGGDPYMLGNPTGVWATGERIFVVDGQIPALRVYDFEGEALRDIGSAGQGPGELRYRLEEHPGTGEQQVVRYRLVEPFE